MAAYPGQNLSGIFDCRPLRIVVTSPGPDDGLGCIRPLPFPLKSPPMVKGVHWRAWIACFWPSSLQT